MEDLVGSASFVTAVKVVTVITLYFAAVQALSLWAHSVLALRAKVKAREALHRAVLSDRRFRAVVDRAAKQKKLDPKQAEILRNMIESHLKVLSKRDQKYVHEGLHQQSAGGAERYVHNLLSGT